MKLQEIENIKKEVSAILIEHAKKQGIKIDDIDERRFFLNDVLDVLTLADCFGFETNNDPHDADLVAILRKYPAKISIAVCEEMQNRQ
jgi:hypothetical protein